MVEVTDVYGVTRNYDSADARDKVRQTERETALLEAAQSGDFSAVTANVSGSDQRDVISEANRILEKYNALEGANTGDYSGASSDAPMLYIGGGQNANGYYRIDRENNQIALSSDVEHTEIILEYISDGSNVNGDNVINTLSEEALRAYIYWKSIQRRRNSTGQDREFARRDWYNEKRLARARVVNFTPDQAKRITRKGFKQSPRF